MTQRIGPFFKYDSKKWTFFKIWLTELNSFFLNLTHRIEPFFFWIWLTELNFFYITERIELLFLIRLKELNFLFYVTQILELFENFWFKEMDPFFSRTQSFFIKKKKTHRIDFLVNPTHRIDFFFCELNRLISWIWRKELNRLISWIWRKDLNPFSKYHSQNWIFSSMTQRIEPFFFLENDEPFFLEYNQRIGLLFLNMTQGIEHLISWIWRKDLNPLFLEYESKNWTLFAYDSKNWNYFWMTQRIELLYMTQRMEPFLNMTHRIELFFD